MAVLSRPRFLLGPRVLLLFCPELEDGLPASWRRWKIFTLFHGSQVSPSARVPVIAQDLLCGLTVLSAGEPRIRRVGRAREPQAELSRLWLGFHEAPGLSPCPGLN